MLPYPVFMLPYPILCRIQGVPKDDLVGLTSREKDKGQDQGSKDKDRDRDDEKKYAELVSVCREFLATATRSAALTHPP
jgi:hypothetical protein